MAAAQSLRVLVPGGSGFIGTAVTTHLTARGHSIVATTTRPSAAREKSVEWVVWDALVEPLPDIDWRTIDVIVHLALPRQPLDDPDQARAIFEPAFPRWTSALDPLNADSMLGVIGLDDVEGGSDVEPGG